MTQLHLEKRAKSLRSAQSRSISGLYMGPTFLIFTMVLMVCSISIITLVFSTKEITKGYALKKLEAEHEELLRDHEAKTMHVAEVRALAAVKASEKVQSMIYPKKVVYYRGDTAIAQR